jgi:hypothetical protein
MRQLVSGLDGVNTIPNASKRCNEDSKTMLAECEYSGVLGEAQLLIQMALGDASPAEDDIQLMEGTHRVRNAQHL